MNLYLGDAIQEEIIHDYGHLKEVAKNIYAAAEAKKSMKVILDAQNDDKDNVKLEQSSVKESLTTDQFISVLVASEWDARRNRSVDRTIRTGCIPL